MTTNDHNESGRDEESDLPRDDDKPVEPGRDETGDLFEEDDFVVDPRYDDIFGTPSDEIRLSHQDGDGSDSVFVDGENGTPLETRKEWGQGRPNPNFGKPLPEHNYLKNIWVIAKKVSSNDEFKFYPMTVTGDLAQDESIPLFKPVRFSAIDKG